MAKQYAYAPLSVEDRNRRSRGGGNGGGHDELVNERMPMCVGICVLLAIVYVLSRTGGDQASTILKNTPTSPNANASPQINSSTSPAVTIPTADSSSSSSTLNIVPEVMEPADMTADNTLDNTQAATTLPATETHGNVRGADTPIEPAPSTVTTATQAAVSDQCAGLVDPANLDMGKVREAAFAKTPPHIIECAKAKRGESQAACHLPTEERYAAVNQKGATLWMTGCSGAGKTTIATMLEDILVKQYGKQVYRLDGDNLRTGLNRDLTFTEADRAESVRRTGEIATLFADAGVITLVGLISPYRKDRDLVRKRHEDSGIPFYEVFLDVPVEELKKRDPKGQYAKVESGELKHFTCIDDPYEEPLSPELTLRTHELTVEQSAGILFNRLHMDGILDGAPKLNPPGLPNPDGDVAVDCHVPEAERAAKRAEAETLAKVRITDIDLNWLQVIGEGWASPLRGFMREGTLLQTLHFNSILVDPFNLTGNELLHESQTEWDDYTDRQPPTRVSMSVPITLALTEFTKKRIESHAKGSEAVALVTQMGQTVAILRRPEIYNNRKEEIVSRMFGVIDDDHPYIKYIYSGGDYLIGGEVELLDRIRYNDGLDKWRKTSQELMEEFKAKGADTVYAFQTRNPTHAGHAYLMRQAGEKLKSKGFKKPVLWLSPLGGWTKSDDVPLDVRIHQHEEVLNAGMTHPGGLDPDSTVMAIWPSPMVYAGPTEVQFHAKSRRSAGASYFVVGRDPAGMKGSHAAVAHKDDDLYDGNHGRYVLQMSPGIGDMKMLSFTKVMYDITDNIMKEPVESRMDDFISISGTKMRLLAHNGAVPCPPDNIPTDLVEANCIPSGFMVPKGWDGVVDYYKHSEELERWVPWSQPKIAAPRDIENTKEEGSFGSTSYRLMHSQDESFWHDIPMHPPASSTGETLINLVVEIPMYMTAKMEVSKELPGNPIAQDTNKDGSPRYYTYGTTFFNYGLIPQTWEDPAYKSPQGYAADNDPLDAIELGSAPLKMGSVTPCKVIGSLQLIDEGEMDNKILCIAVTDPDYSRINSCADLDVVKPGLMDNLRDWLKNYKTSDGKPVNSLASDIPGSVTEAMEIVQETHERWKTLCGKSGGTYGSTISNPQDADGFWLQGGACRG